MKQGLLLFCLYLNVAVCFAQSDQTVFTKVSSFVTAGIDNQKLKQKALLQVVELPVFKCCMYKSGFLEWLFFERYYLGNTQTLRQLQSFANLPDIFLPQSGLAVWPAISEHFMIQEVWYETG